MKYETTKTERKTPLPTETIAALNNLAAKNGADLSKEIRRTIDSYLDTEVTAKTST